MGREPTRRCVGCGRTAPKRELRRFTVADGRVVPDPVAHRTGRGAYLCPSPACLEQALRRRAFPRAFRRAVAAEGKTLESTD